MYQDKESRQKAARPAGGLRPPVGGRGGRSLCFAPRCSAPPPWCLVAPRRDLFKIGRRSAAQYIEDVQNGRLDMGMIQLSLNRAQIVRAFVLSAGKRLSCRVRRGVSAEAERLSRPLNVRPDGLPRAMLAFRPRGRKHPLFATLSE